MVRRYKFEIQNCITVEELGDNKDEARIRVIDNLAEYSEEMLDGNCYVSDGEEVK